MSGFEIDTAGSYRIQKSTDLESVKYIQSSGSLGKVDEERQTSSKRESRTPIIIVPAALTSVITLQNAKEFLQDEKYVPISVVFSQAVGDILIQRRKDNYIYRVSHNYCRIVKLFIDYMTLE